MIPFEKILSGGDLRSIGKSNEIVKMTNSHSLFDDLFKCIYHPDRRVVMRAADAIEKITAKNPLFLDSHKKEIIFLCNNHQNIEVAWHLAQILPRLDLSVKEVASAWKILTTWVTDKNNSRILRVNALQALFDLAQIKPEYRSDFHQISQILQNEDIPSIKARIKKLNRLQINISES